MGWLINKACAIDHLYEKSSNASFKDVGITYFYFKHDDHEKSNEEIAKILLRNLISKINILPPSLVKMFNNEAQENPPKLQTLGLSETDTDAAAKTKYGGWTALHWAAKEGHKDVVALLLDKMILI